ncbi:IclR family transcriptional regulator [Streptomyces sp. QL37]|uniref:IclR family transcriptional regulator n=1 Tax=Streptomyces sp. QL37 TaxID=2093747 RepID=UPI000CF2E9E8|nr:IclR family transcriptional regulator [Streptomyces sp. QL37]PPQ59828.1 IclR family transcriptional regulator [Streptomyces sp. QL37]
MGKPVNSRSKEQPPAGQAVGQSVMGPVDKAMEVLSALVETGAPHRLADLARRTGLTKPTVHRLLRGLAASGFAEPAEGGSYRAGPRLLGLAAAALDSGPGLHLIRPVLAELRSRTGLLAHYAVRDGDFAVCLETSEPAREYALELRPGSRAPLLLCAPGLAMLAALPPEEAEPAFAAGESAGHPLPVPAAELRDEIAAAAERGYALDDQYEQEDRRALAAAVRDGEGRIAGAVVLTGLVFTLDRAGVELYGPMVRAAARAVSAGLGSDGRARLAVARDTARSAARGAAL